MALLHIGHEHLARATSLLDFLEQWELSPYVLVPLAAILGAYLFGTWRLERRSKYPVVRSGRTLLFAGGFLALALALVSPIDVYAGDLFFMHMIQHLLLMMVAAPLLLLASPMAVYLWALPEAVRRRVGRTLSMSGVLRWILKGATVPVAAWLVYVVVIWVWHAPAAYNESLVSEGVHALEHLTMFGAAVLFWWPVIGPAPIRSHLAYPLRFLYLFLALFQNIVLGAILTFADAPVYSYYESTPDHWGVSADLDQQLGGILMWIPGAMMYFTALSILFFSWLSQEERQNARWAADEEKRRRYYRAQGLPQRVLERSGMDSS